MMRNYCGLRGALGLLALLSVVGSAASRAAVFQWSGTVDDLVSSETKAHPRAFLWVPEGCERVRGVVVAPQNMEEEQLFQDAGFRKTLSELGFAEVWITPGLSDVRFRFDKGDGERLEKLLKALGEVSGYGEIGEAPLVAVGHSATASWGWDVAAWKPERVLAVVSLSGQWPYFDSGFWKGRSVDGVPGLTTKGEYEIQGSLESGWYAGLKGDFYVKHPSAAFTQVVEPGGGHFEASAEKIALIGMYLKKAAERRLSKEAGGALRSIDAGKEGWRYEVWRREAGPSAPAAMVGYYKGVLEKSFWAFDREMAEGIERFQNRRNDGLPVLLAYGQTGGLTAPVPDHAMVHLKFEPLDDDLHFSVTPEFWDRVPGTKDGKKAEWQGWLEGMEQGAAIEHPAGKRDLLQIEPIRGPVEQVGAGGAGRFAIRFHQFGMNNAKRSNDVWLVMTYPGDGHFKRMVQQAELKFPLVNAAGVEQAIAFPEIGDVVAGRTEKFELKGEASSGLPVHYYVREGPAEVDDAGVLRLTEIPPRAKYPVEVTVVAWQWGRAGEPRVRSAKPVERGFWVRR